MYLIGAILFTIIGLLIIICVPKLYSKYQNMDFSVYPKKEAIVLHTYNFYGERWVVEIKENDNEKFLAIDSIPTSSTFLKKYHIPKTGEKVDIYYWESKDKNKFSINNTYLKYEFHFCDESFYELQKKKIEYSIIGSKILGILFIIGAVLIFINR